MRTFDPLTDIHNSKLILDQGHWPNFHDAEVHNLNIKRGLVDPERDIWIGTSLTLELELCALQHPYKVILQFNDCDQISLTDFNHQNAIYDLQLEFFERGLLKNGEPMTPGIRVTFEQAFGMALSFNCMQIAALNQPAIDSSKDT